MTTLTQLRQAMITLLLSKTEWTHCRTRRRVSHRRLLFKWQLRWLFSHVLHCLQWIKKINIIDCLLIVLSLWTLSKTLLFEFEFIYFIEKEWTQSIRRHRMCQRAKCTDHIARERHVDVARAGRSRHLLLRALHSHIAQFWCLIRICKEISLSFSSFFSSFFFFKPFL